MTTLVTGATGLVGSHVTRLLVARGDAVRVLVRERSPRDELDGLEVELAYGDVLDRASVRRAMRGVQRLFHVAGITSLRASADRVFAVNVGGTRIVLEEALRAGVARVVHTSSVAAVGPAVRGSTADEDQVFRAGRYGLPYVNAKHEAEREVDWRPAHHEDTLQTTIDWYREREPARLKAPGTRQPLALRAAGLGLRTAGGMLRSFAP